jgi:hypothetical protein
MFLLIGMKGGRSYFVASRGSARDCSYRMYQRHPGFSVLAPDHFTRIHFKLRFQDSGFDVIEMGEELIVSTSIARGDHLNMIAFRERRC